MQFDLLDGPYRDGGPGYKERGGASEDAAKKVKGKAAKIRAQVYALFAHNQSLTFKEIERMTSLHRDSIKPRLTELFKAGKLIKIKGERREGCTPYARAE